MCRAGESLPFNIEQNFSLANQAMETRKNIIITVLVHILLVLTILGVFIYSVMSQSGNI